MSSTVVSASVAARNRLLAALPSDELQRLLPEMRVVHLDVGQMVFEREQRLRVVHFPLTAILSMVNEDEHGGSVEVGTVGHEGMNGIPVALDAHGMPTTCFCQIEGDSITLPADVVRREMVESGAFTRVLHRYTMFFLTMVAQGSACNRLHEVDERCARWLLMTHDRADSDTFRLTQEFLAVMMGVRRASVSVAAAALQKAGFITYRRGEITVLNRAGLEQATCECYGIITREYERLLG
ncbi:MAG TPA: Crp/Fnr family transcriptional regulator [Deinococcales bacterium]|nr:Crp/Fnr family transcriptional regulator [Deinococcales bacterium]